jgi:uncharacterized protein YfaQ (DUF2300 family)
MRQRNEEIAIEVKDLQYQLTQMPSQADDIRVKLKVWRVFRLLICVENNCFSHSDCKPLRV